MKDQLQLPEAFVRRVEHDLGAQSAAFFKSLDLDSPVSVRINLKKMEQAPSDAVIPWSQTGYYLPERPVFTLDPLFHAGAYYVQEASSMFLEQVLNQVVDLSQPLKVLDLSAAPGGKSTHILSLISDDSFLVSNDVIRSRAKILAENLTKWGQPNVVVTNNDPSDFQKLSGFFDVVVVDAPCSGEGLFRKDHQAANEWSEENVNLCALRQRRIVADVWEVLKPGGVIIYSTCTYNQQENEENLQWMIDEMEAEPIALDISNFPDITMSDKFSGYHFYPHKTRGEGFFIAALRKTNGSDLRMWRLKKPPLFKAPVAIQKEISGWIQMAKRFDYWLFQDKVLAFPTLWSNELMWIIDKLSIVQCGIEVCEVKAKNLIPSHALAISTILNQAHFMDEELDHHSSLVYLKKDEIKPVGTDQYLLVTHQHVPLGFLKKAGNRYNNLYPKEWRIRMEIK